MKQALRIVLILFGTLVVFVVLAMLVLPRFMDARRIGDRMAAAVLERTGRELDLAGDVQVSVFPWPGVSLSQVSLGGPPELEEETFARADHLQLRGKLFPLLRGRMDLDRVVVRGLDLNLVRMEDGRVNWKFSQGAVLEEPALPRAPSPEDPSAPSLAALAPFSVGRMEIRDGSVRVTDHKDERSFRLHNLHMESSRVVEKEPFDFSIHSDFESAMPPVAGDFSLVARGRIEKGGERIAFHPARLDLRARGEVFGRELSDGRVESNVVVDLVREKVSLEDLEVRFFATRMGGRLELADFSPRPAVRFHLMGEELDLDYLRSALVRPQEHAPEAEGGGRGEFEETQPLQGVPPHSKSGGMPWAPLLAMELDGVVHMDRVRLQGGLLEEVLVGVGAKGGTLRLEPVRARLYGGQMESGFFLDARGAQPGIQGVKRLTGVQLGPMLRDMAGRETVSGTGDFSMDLRAEGHDGHSLLSSLQGNTVIMVREGALQGVNISRLIRDAHAVLRGQGGLDGEVGAEHTEFSRMSGTFLVHQGTARSEDLSLLSSLFTLRGTMEADLPRSRMDARTRIRVTEAFRARDGSRVEELLRLEIPLRISGPFESLRYSLDTEALARDLLRRRGQEILERFLPKEENRESPALEDPLRRLFRP